MMNREFSVQLLAEADATIKISYRCAPRQSGHNFRYHRGLAEEKVPSNSLYAECDGIYCRYVYRAWVNRCVFF